VVEHTDRGGRLVEHIKVHARHAGRDQFLDLPGGEGHAGLELRGFVVSGRLEGPRERLGEPCLAEAGDAADLGVVGDGHHPRHDRCSDSEGGAAVTEAEKIRIVVEQLRDDDVSAGVALSLEILEVGLGADRFLVRLRVAGHENVEFGKLAPDQRREFGRIAQAAGSLLKGRFALGRVAAEGDDRRHADTECLAEISAELVHRAAHAGEVAGDGKILPGEDALEHVERGAAGGAAGSVGAGDERRVELQEFIHGPPHHRLRLGRLGRKELERQPEPAACVGVLDRHGDALPRGLE